MLITRPANGLATFLGRLKRRQLLITSAVSNRKLASHRALVPAVPTRLQHCFRPCTVQRLRPVLASIVALILRNPGYANLRMMDGPTITGIRKQTRFNGPGPIIHSPPPIPVTSLLQDQVDHRRTAFVQKQQPLDDSSHTCTVGLSVYILMILRSSLQSYPTSPLPDQQHETAGQEQARLPHQQHHMLTTNTSRTHCKMHWLSHLPRFLSSCPLQPVMLFRR